MTPMKDAIARLIESKREGENNDGYEGSHDADDSFI